jgi:DNA-binding transcriptional regulator YiaG
MKVARLLLFGQDGPMTNDDLRLVMAARAHAISGTGLAIRRASGLSLAEIGSVVGATESTIWRWERGQARPRGDRAVRWARLLSMLERSNTSTAA